MELLDGGWIYVALCLATIAGGIWALEAVARARRGASDAVAALPRLRLKSLGEQDTAGVIRIRARCDEPVTGPWSGERGAAVGLCAVSERRAGTTSAGVHGRRVGWDALDYAWRVASPWRTKSGTPIHLRGAVRVIRSDRWAFEKRPVAELPDDLAALARRHYRDELDVIERLVTVRDGVWIWCRARRTAEGFELHGPRVGVPIYLFVGDTDALVDDVRATYLGNPSVNDPRPELIDFARHLLEKS